MIARESPHPPQIPSSIYCKILLGQENNSGTSYRFSGDWSPISFRAERPDRPVPASSHFSASDGKKIPPAPLHCRCILTGTATVHLSHPYFCFYLNGIEEAR